MTGARKFHGCLQNYGDLESITDESRGKAVNSAWQIHRVVTRNVLTTHWWSFRLKRGGVVNVADNCFVAEFEAGHVKPFVVPHDFEFDVQGKQMTVRDLSAV